MRYLEKDGFKISKETKEIHHIEIPPSSPSPTKICPIIDHDNNFPSHIKIDETIDEDIDAINKCINEMVDDVDMVMDEIDQIKNMSIN